MSFVAGLNSLPIAGLLNASLRTTISVVRGTLAKRRLGLADFAQLLSPAAGELLAELCHRSQALTRQRFGKVIRLFAPLYLSNECVNQCKYCGF